MTAPRCSCWAVTETTVNEYDLSSPFDASTLSFVDATGIGGQDTNPRRHRVLE